MTAFTSRIALALLAGALSLPALAGAQGLSVQGDVPTKEELLQVRAQAVEIPAGGRGALRVALSILPGWHVNANPPALDYMIPTEVTLEPTAGLTAGRPRYPAPHKAKLSFEDTELLVYDGEGIVEIPLAVAAGAATGPRALKGRVRFQACNDQLCLPPASIEFEAALTIAPGVGGAAPAVPAPPLPSAEPAPTAGRTPEPGTSFQTAPPAGGAAAAALNPIARLFERGSALAFLSLFAIGLALTLTPCVYPMLGVTVSIFGARRAAPPLQVVAFATLYVLGIAVMYSTLGVVAALSGGLFGSFLQSPIVLIVIGVLLGALALSMFGLYEFQLPPALLSRLGGAGTTSALGIFASGLVVGIFAAPCIGPPVVALLALVGAKADPWFGFLTFFTLSLGLGAPYLVLATFSNLVQRLPRSGDWMVWVKKLFGVILIGVAAFYVLLGVAPSWAPWVLPVGLVAGGLYLGFLEGSARERKGFRWVRLGTGVTGLLAGAMIVITTPREGIAFRPYDPAVVQGDLPRERPVMLDFSADWCVPCHELERHTFTDARVKDAARTFDAFKVDLTRYDSPEAERWRKEYEITGVPTIVFLHPSGREVREARVEGFLPPAAFLDRMRLAVSSPEQPRVRAGSLGAP